MRDYKSSKTNCAIECHTAKAIDNVKGTIGNVQLIMINDMRAARLNIINTTLTSVNY